MPGIFTGNGSVAWLVEANNVRKASSKLDPPRQGRLRRVRQSGIDETDPDEYFTIAIKVPRDKDEGQAFIKELNERARALKQGQTLTLRLPIEDKRHNRPGRATDEQIVVSWPSSKTPRATKP